MSLLPSQIQPETVPIGRSNPDGTVTIEHNWWLFLYNVWLNVLGGGNNTSTNPPTYLSIAKWGVD